MVSTLDHSIRNFKGYLYSIWKRTLSLLYSCKIIEYRSRRMIFFPFLCDKLVIIGSMRFYLFTYLFKLFNFLWLTVYIFTHITGGVTAVMKILHKTAFCTLSYLWMTYSEFWMPLSLWNSDICYIIQPTIAPLHIIHTYVYVHTYAYTNICLHIYIFLHTYKLITHTDIYILAWIFRFYSVSRTCTNFFFLVWFSLLETTGML